MDWQSRSLASLLTRTRSQFEISSITASGTCFTDISKSPVKPREIERKASIYLVYSCCYSMGFISRLLSLPPHS
jgi:hypothetical protein